MSLAAVATAAPISPLASGATTPAARQNTPSRSSELKAPYRAPQRSISSAANTPSTVFASAIGPAADQPSPHSPVTIELATREATISPSQLRRGEVDSAASSTALATHRRETPPSYLVDTTVAAAAAK